MKRILVIGATSAIARATVEGYARQGDKLFLVGRDADRTEAVASHLTTLGATSAHTRALDATDVAAHAAVLSEAADAMDGIDIALIAYGTLPDQARCQEDFSAAGEAFDVNAVSVLSWMTHLANYLEREGSGTLCVITSVAGDRGRPSNYVYGAAKAAIDTVAEGMRARLASSGVSVVTIKPGFVDTPMTAEFDKGILWARPETVGRSIRRGIARHKAVVYTPWFWRWIMLVIRLLPRWIFRRLPL